MLKVDFAARDYASASLRTLMAIACSLIAALACTAANAQNRVDLEDMNIKGELLNDNRLRTTAREKHQISDRVTYRSDFRKEITDSLEIPWPEANRSGQRSAASTGNGDNP